MIIDIPEADTFIEGIDVIEESANVKQRMTRMGQIVKNIEMLDFQVQDKNIDNSALDSPTMMPKIDPNRRVQTRKNIGLFFGHENWNLIMHMMIAFRAGLKL